MYFTLVIMSQLCHVFLLNLLKFALKTKLYSERLSSNQNTFPVRKLKEVSPFFIYLCGNSLLKTEQLVYFHFTILFSWPHD